MGKKWTPQMDRTLLDMIARHSVDMRSDANLGVFWDCLAREMRDETGVMLDSGACRKRCDLLAREHDAAVVARFIRKRCDFGDRYQTQCGDVCEAFCETDYRARLMGPMSNRRFGALVRVAGFDLGDRTKSGQWCGIRLKPETDPSLLHLTACPAPEPDPPPQPPETVADLAAVVQTGFDAIMAKLDAIQVAWE